MPSQEYDLPILYLQRNETASHPARQPHTYHIINDTKTNYQFGCDGQNDCFLTTELQRLEFSFFFIQIPESRKWQIYLIIWDIRSPGLVRI